jgi:hypothetical protein
VEQDEKIASLLRILGERVSIQDSSIIEQRLTEGIQFLVFHLPKEQVFLIATDGLRHTKMNVPENWVGWEHIELYVCLPDYVVQHSTEALDHWLVASLKRVTLHFSEHKPWYGPGHTFNIPETLKKTEPAVKFDQLLLATPILFNKEFQGFNLEESDFHLLPLIPIFQIEFDEKQRQGYSLFFRKLLESNANEKMDDFRLPLYKRRFKLF